MVLEGHELLVERAREQEARRGAAGRPHARDASSALGTRSLAPTAARHRRRATSRPGYERSSSQAPASSWPARRASRAAANACCSRSSSASICAARSVAASSSRPSTSARPSAPARTDSHSPSCPDRPSRDARGNDARIARGSFVDAARACAKTRRRRPTPRCDAGCARRRRSARTWRPSRNAPPDAAAARARARPAPRAARRRLRRRLPSARAHAGSAPEPRGGVADLLDENRVQYPVLQRTATAPKRRRRRMVRRRRFAIEVDGLRIRPLIAAYARLTRPVAMPIVSTSAPSKSAMPSKRSDVGWSTGASMWRLPCRRPLARTDHRGRHVVPIVQQAVAHARAEVDQRAVEQRCRRRPACP